MTYELIIFDNDGVLVDSETLIKRAQQDAFSKAGFAVDNQWLWEHTIGLNWKGVAANLERCFGKAVRNSVGDKVASLFTEYLPELKEVTGAKAFVEGLSVPSCIATSGNREITPLKLEYAGLSSFFNNENTFTSYHEEVKRGKPAPDLFLFAAEKMGFAPEKCVVIEDSAAGIEGAKAAGMTAVGFLAGSHSQYIKNHEQQLIDAGADYVAKSFDEVREFLNK